MNNNFRAIAACLIACFILAVEIVLIIELEDVYHHLCDMEDRIDKIARYMD